MKPFLIPVSVWIVGLILTTITEETTSDDAAFLVLDVTLLAYGYLTYHLSPKNKALSNSIISSTLCAILSYIILKGFELDMKPEHTIIGVALLFVGAYIAHTKSTSSKEEKS